MANLMKTFLANTDVAEAGVWCDFDGTFFFEYEGVKHVTRFKLKHASETNGAYFSMIEKAMKKFINRRGKNKATFDQTFAIEVRAFCTHVLVGWEGFEESRPEQRQALIDAGKAPLLEYSYENAVAIMTAAPELFKLLLEWAQEPGNFNTFGEDVKKPLPDASPGTFPKS